MKREKQELNANNIKLNEECKELQLNLQEMTQKYNKLYRKSNIDEGDFINWSTDDITNGICNLDVQYESFEDVLRNNLKKEDVDGSILRELEKQDLHRFGIVSMKHKLNVYKNIKRITSQHAQQPVFGQLNEGNIAPTAYI